MIEVTFSTYSDKKYLSVDLEDNGTEFLNVNLEKGSLVVEIHKNHKNLEVDFDDFFNQLVFAKAELQKLYPEILGTSLH
jgi:hypothetical protein